MDDTKASDLCKAKSVHTLRAFTYFVPQRTGSLCSIIEMEQFAMSTESKLCSLSVSRRDFLNVAAIGGGAIIAAGLSGPAAAAPKKFTQQQAHYQPVPKSGNRCQSCALWQAPSSCQVVEGQISPAGWCILYQQKR